MIRRLAFLAAVWSIASCGGSVASSDSAAKACTRTPERMCPGQPYRVCLDIQEDAGRCVDWSGVGATACPNGEGDCPRVADRRIAGSFGSLGPVIACVASDQIQSRKPYLPPEEVVQGSSPGYCAVYHIVSDSTKTLDCADHICGADGHCSILTGSSNNTVECFWPL